MTKVNIKKALVVASYIVDIIATIIIVMFILNFDKPSNNKNLYMMESTVIDVSENIVTVETVDNEIFSFRGNGTWLANDGVILLLDNQGTKDITDDVIVDTLYDMR